MTTLATLPDAKPVTLVPSFAQIGTYLRPGAPIDEWTRAAGFNFDVKRAPVMFNANHPQEGEDADFAEVPEMRSYSNRETLFRSDNGNPLSVVSKSYQIVQPSEVMGFFSKLVEIGGFELECAGTLDGGRRLWGLAKVNDGAPVIGHDVVRPYIMLATSYDATLSTMAKFTTIRSVCSNALSMETHTEGKAVNSLVRIPHQSKVDFDLVMKSLGIAGNVFEKWLIEASLLAEKKMVEDEFKGFLVKLLEPTHPPLVHGRPSAPIHETGPFQRMLEIFDTDMIGSDMTGGDTRWRALNAVTQYVDHERGRSVDNRMKGSWFGAGDKLKSFAQELLVTTPEFAPLPEVVA